MLISEIHPLEMQSVRLLEGSQLHALKDNSGVEYLSLWPSVNQDGEVLDVLS
ncbi:MAG: hypothetical protein WBD34_17920 [Burkholderiaceae bacterium]